MEKSVLLSGFLFVIAQEIIQNKKIMFYIIFIICLNSIFIYGTVVFEKYWMWSNANCK